MRLDSNRQIGGYLLHRATDLVAEREQVAAVAHGNADGYRGLAVDAKHRLWGVGIGALDGSNVACAEQPSACHEIDSPQCLLGGEIARHPDLDFFRAGL